MLQAHFKTIQAKSASTLLCTFASSVLVPTALRHTTNGLNLVLVLAVATVWMMSLSRMWMVVIGEVRCRFAARNELAAMVAQQAIPAKRTRLAPERNTLPNVEESANLLAVYKIRAHVIIPERAGVSMSHPAGA